MARYVMVAFDTDEAAEDFLNYLHELPTNPTTRELRAASKPKDGKVSIRKFKIRAAYLRDD